MCPLRLRLRCRSWLPATEGSGAESSAQPAFRCEWPEEHEDRVRGVDVFAVHDLGVCAEDECCQHFTVDCGPDGVTGLNPSNSGSAPPEASFEACGGVVVRRAERAGDLAAEGDGEREVFVAF